VIATTANSYEVDSSLRNKYAGERLILLFFLGLVRHGWPPQPAAPRRRLPPA
jgi:hypothetical protein